jgi:hypothetical protein
LSSRVGEGFVEENYFLGAFTAVLYFFLFTDYAVEEGLWVKNYERFITGQNRP